MPNDTNSLRVEQELRLRGEIVKSDFVKLATGDPNEDVVLHDNDRVMVPEHTSTVYVFGQVVSPSHIPVMAGKDISYYIKRAGGAAERAREGDAVVIKGTTRQWLSSSETTVEEGDYIWVPRTRERTLEEQLTIITQVASVVATAATLILLTRVK